MSTVYSGSATATQAPSDPPVDGTAPKVTLPADGDPLNAASVAQAFKVPADFLTFLRNAFANSGTFGQPIESWSDQNLNKRTEVDYAGLFRDNTFRWTEDFTPGSGFSSAGTGTTNVGRWSIVNVGAGAATYSEPPAYVYSNPPQPASLVGRTVHNTSRELAIEVDGGASSNRSELRMNDNYVTASYGDDALISCEWHATNFTNLSVAWSIGFAGDGEFVDNIQHGLFFYRPDTVGTNWICRSINGGSPVDVDSGVLATAGVTHVFRIDFVGANYLGGTGHAFFWIDGTLVGNAVTGLPVNNGTLAIPTIGGAITSGSVAAQSILCNRINYRQIERAAL